MLWVFIGLVVLIVSLLVPFLQQVMETVKNSMYISPSSAIIDQAMPEEILEQIFSNMDPLTLLQAYNVSKYWRFNASKNRVKIAVVERYTSAVNNSEDMKKLLERNGQSILLAYPAKYSVDPRLRDMALAEKRGRTLLELDLGGMAAHELIKGLSEITEKKYIIKSRATLNNRLPTFRVGVNSVTPVNSAPLLPLLVVREDQTSDRKIPYEVMLDLEDYVGESGTNKNVAIVMCRNPHPTKKLLGFIPMDGSFVKIMVFLLLPLVVHDAINSEFMKYLKLWFGPAAFIVMNVILAQENWQSLEYTRVTINTPLYKKLIIGTPIAATIGFLALYPYSSTHFAFIGIFVGTFGYIFTLHDTVVVEETMFTPKSKERAKLFILCMTLVLLANDWSAAIQSILDGSIWPRLFWNTVHFLVFLLYPIWNNVMSCVAEETGKPFKWKHFINWPLDVIKLMACFYGTAVFVTLYAPHWQGNY